MSIYIDIGRRQSSIHNYGHEDPNSGNFDVTCVVIDWGEQIRPE